MSRNSVPCTGAAPFAGGLFESRLPPAVHTAPAASQGRSPGRTMVIPKVEVGSTRISQRTLLGG